MDDTALPLKLLVDVMVGVTVGMWKKKKKKKKIRQVPLNHVRCTLEGREIVRNGEENVIIGDLVVRESGSWNGERIHVLTKHMRMPVPPGHLLVVVALVELVLVDVVLVDEVLVEVVLVSEVVVDDVALTDEVVDTSAVALGTAAEALDNAFVLVMRVVAVVVLQ